MSSKNPFHAPRGIAWARHHRARLAKKRKGYFVFQNICPAYRDRALGILIDTPAMCSCWMCGNPRRIWKEKPFAEQRADLTWRERWEDAQNWE